MPDNVLLDSLEAQLTRECIELDKFGNQLDSLKKENYKRVAEYKAKENELNIPYKPIEAVAAGYFWYHAGGAIIRGLKSLKRELGYFFKPFGQVLASVTPNVVKAGLENLHAKLPTMPKIGALISEGIHNGEIGSLISKASTSKLGQILAQIPLKHPLFKVAKRLAFVAAAYSELKTAPKIWDYIISYGKREEVIAGDQELNRLKIENDMVKYANNVRRFLIEDIRKLDPEGIKTTEIIQELSSASQSGKKSSIPTPQSKDYPLYEKIMQYFSGSIGFEMFGPESQNKDKYADRWLKSSVQIPRDSLDYWGSYKNLFKKSPNLQFNVSKPEIITLDEETYNKISEINLDVNKSIHYIGDEVKAGKEDEMTVVQNQFGLGDCDDYAVTKIDRLVKAGYPRSALRLGFVTVGEEGHMVTIVTTDRGDFVLDNNSQEVLPWYKAGKEYRYKYIALESPTSSDKHDVLIPE